MKKLKLDLKDMENVQVLTREQLKKIVGGNMGSGGDGGSSTAKCTVKCSDGKEKSRDCGSKQCSTSGTIITCGADDSQDMCA